MTCKSSYAVKYYFLRKNWMDLNISALRNQANSNNLINPQTVVFTTGTSFYDIVTSNSVSHPYPRPLLIIDLVSGT